jgi:adenine-specific DNA-methyltransferase
VRALNLDFRFSATSAARLAPKSDFATSYEKRHGKKCLRSGLADPVDERIYIVGMPQAVPASKRSVSGDLIGQVEQIRQEATAAVDPGSRSELGQVFTPPPVSGLMASMFQQRETMRLLDAGAGSGSLSAAVVAMLLEQDHPPESISVVAFELDPALIPYLDRSLSLCASACDEAGIRFESQVLNEDFLAAVASGTAPNDFNCAILNPPYRKIRTNSDARRYARELGIEVSNLYAAFVAASVLLLEHHAEIVAITPRSFANGPYFRAFRRFLLDRVALKRIHLFDSRRHAFKGDDVLQENVIVCAERNGAAPPDTVEITASETPDDPVRSRSVPFGRVVYSRDPEQFIHLIVDEEGDEIAETMGALDNYLSDLEIEVSTGPVVDFRIEDCLRKEIESGSVPLLYPGHLNKGAVVWPRPNVKANALALTDESWSQTVERGNYVLVKRFTSKEEKRRVVAATCEDAGAERIAFENHLNYFHKDRKGLSRALTLGLAAYLNSSLVDAYFRQFSGHTQVNAADLRNMPYPSRDHLESAGEQIDALPQDQQAIDALVERFLLR